MSRPTIVVVVVGTGTDVGKTWASCEILRDAARRGMTVAARKPAQSFAAGAPVTDASLLSEASGEDPIVVCPSHRWYPKAMAPPMAADALGRPEIALEELANEITWPAGIDFGLVEMAGGAASPIAHDGDCTDLAHRVAPDLVLLVAHAGLGTINSVRLSARGYAPLALVVLLNRFDPFDELHRANREWLVSNEGLSVIVDPADVLAPFPAAAACPAPAAFADGATGPNSADGPHGPRPRLPARPQAERTIAAPNDIVPPVTDRIAYDEFGLFHENASEFGLPFERPPVVRREFVEVAPGRRLSALVWGDGDPEFVFVHGGAQNAHTWDTVALALGRPMIAVDLPGHGHSDSAGDRPGGPLSIDGNAADVEVVARALAPRATALIGMSLGGLTSIGLAGRAPDIVRSLVLVDITPGVTGPKSQAISDFVNGPKTFPSFDDILARTIEHNPTRTVASLRRGILHNAIQLDDGSWVWRYRRFDGPTLGDGGDATDRLSQFAALWEIVGGLPMPVLLLRGMRPQSVVDDADEAELVRRLPSARVVRIVNAGHSVQGDTPVELAQLISDFASRI